jgi:hypothetical protein
MVDLYADLSSLSDPELQEALAASPGDPALPRELTMRRVAKLLPGAPRGLLVALWCAAAKPWLEPQSLPAPWAQVVADLARHIAKADAQAGLERIRPDLPLGGQAVVNAAIAAARKSTGADHRQLGAYMAVAEGLRLLQEECKREGKPLTDELCRQRFGMGRKKATTSVELCDAAGVANPDDFQRITESHELALRRLEAEDAREYLSWQAGFIPLIPGFPEAGYTRLAGPDARPPRQSWDNEDLAKESLRIFQRSQRAGVMPLEMERERERWENAEASGRISPHPQQKADGSWFCPNGGRVVWDEVENWVTRVIGTRVETERREVPAVRREVDREITAALLEEGLRITFESVQARRIKRLETEPELVERLYETIERKVDITEQVQDGTRQVPRCATTLESLIRVRDEWKKNPEALRRLAIEAFGPDGAQQGNAEGE